MSQLFSSYKIEQGLVPPDREIIRCAGEQALSFLATNYPKFAFVPFGSVATGFYTRRSDIDLVLATPIKDYEDYLRVFYDTDEGEGLDDTRIKKSLKQLPLIDRWQIPFEIYYTSSRRDDKLEGKDPASYENRPKLISLAPTTFDHFALLARNLSIPAETRQHYRALQREVRCFSRTDKGSRILDLRTYLEYWQREIERIDSVVRPKPWDLKWENELDLCGRMENFPLHVIRKLAGIGRILEHRDDLIAIQQLMEGSDLPLLVALRPPYQLFWRFREDYEQLLNDCCTGSVTIWDYGYKVNELLFNLLVPGNIICRVVKEAIEDRTFLEQLATYDRQQPKTVILHERFFSGFLKDCQQEKGVCDFAWAAVGTGVYCGPPSSAFAMELKEGQYRFARDRKGNLIRVTANWRHLKDDFNGFRPELANSNGVIIIDFRDERRVIITCDKIFPENQEGSALAIQAVYQKLKSEFPGAVYERFPEYCHD